MNKINSDLAKSLEDLQKQYSNTMKDVNSLTTAELQTLVANNKTQLTQLNFDTANQLATLKQSYTTGGNNIVSGFGSSMQSLLANTNANLGTLVHNVTDAFYSSNDDFYNAGDYAADGFARGIRNGTYRAVNAAEYLARAAVNAAERVLDEGSPSKVFHGIGQFVSLGFANGIVDYANKAETASEKMANGPIAAISKALAEIDETDEWTPVITPILDLSKLGAEKLSQLFDPKRPIALASVSGKMAAEAIQNGSKSEEPVSSIVNYFNLPGLAIRTPEDIDGIATKLYQKQESAQRGRGIRVAPIRR